MLHLVLYEPEIPQNAGNIIRLCANTGVTLHLIEPFGFELDDRKLKRAGLDYHEYADLKIHPNFAEFCQHTAPNQIWGLTTKGTKTYTDARFGAGDAILFGPESRGLPQDLRDDLGVEQCLRIPMRAHSRSLNLSNAAAIVLYEAWRQLNFVEFKP